MVAEHIFAYISHLGTFVVLRVRCSHHPQPYDLILPGIESAWIVTDGMVCSGTKCSIPQVRDQQDGSHI